MKYRKTSEISSWATFLCTFVSESEKEREERGGGGGVGGGVLML